MPIGLGPAKERLCHRRGPRWLPAMEFADKISGQTVSLQMHAASMRERRAATARFSITLSKMIDNASRDADLFPAS